VLNNQSEARIAAHRSLDTRLLASVRSNVTLRDELLPALMDVYVAAGIVEGLDVDKEDFDKYSVRRGIADVILGTKLISPFELSKSVSHHVYIMYIELSIVAAQSQRLLAIAQPDSPHNADATEFVSTALGDLLHLLDDVFSRLTNVCQLQQAMADKKTWSKQSMGARVQRERYMAGEGHVARAYYSLADGILSMLTVVARQATPLFLHHSTLPKAVTLVLHVLRALCSDAAKEINVCCFVVCRHNWMLILFV
jgi:hypothetical protein